MQGDIRQSVMYLLHSGFYLCCNSRHIKALRKQEKQGLLRDCFYPVSCKCDQSPQSVLNH